MIMKKNYPKPLSVKITLFFTAITFFVVLSFTFLMVNSLTRSLEKKRSDEILYYLDLLERTFSQSLSKNTTAINSIPYYILYKITTDNNTTLYTNDPLIPLLPDTKEKTTDTFFEKDFFLDGDLNLLYTTKSVSYVNEENGTSSKIRIQVAIDMQQDDTHLIVQGLPAVFLLYIVPILIISGFLGFFVSNRFLKPIKKITVQAKEISGESLNKRLDTTGPHDELWALACTFNDLFTRLEEDFERQKRFTSDAAHELKTPLAVISGYVNLLLRWGKTDAKILEESLTMLKKECESMTTLTENLLQLTRMENDLIPYEEVTLPLNPFLAELIHSYSIISPDTCFVLECPPDASVNTNKNGLQELLRILIKNSIDYSPQPAHITVTWKNNTLTISDQGNGIAPEDLPYIFDRFYRGDKARTRSSGGSGLGLSIAKVLAQKLHLTIRAESIEKQGTSIHLEFSSTAVLTH